MVHDKLRRRRGNLRSPLSGCVIPNAFNNRAGSIENRAVITFQYLCFNARTFHSIAMYLPSLRSNRLIEIPTRRAWRKRFSRRTTYSADFIRQVRFRCSFPRGKEAFSSSRKFSSCYTGEFHSFLLFTSNLNNNIITVFIWYKKR